MKATLGRTCAIVLWISRLDGIRSSTFPVRHETGKNARSRTRTRDRCRMAPRWGKNHAQKSRGTDDSVPLLEKTPKRSQLHRPLALTETMRAPLPPREVQGRGATQASHLHSASSGTPT